MKFLKAGLDFYINSSVHVAIAVCCFVLISFARFDILYDAEYISFVFFGTITGYNFIKYAPSVKLRHLSLPKKIRFIQIFSFFAFIGFLVSAFNLPFKILFISCLFGMFSLFYVLPVFPGKKNLRSYSGLKIFVITVVVLGVTIIVPALQKPEIFSSEVLPVFVQRFCFILAVIIPFEIRDVEQDASGLGTIPQKIGVKQSKFVGISMLLFFLILEFFHPFSNEVFKKTTFVISLIAAGFLLFSTTKQPKYYASFWVEAIPIFWFCIFLLFRSFS